MTLAVGFLLGVTFFALPRGSIAQALVYLAIGLLAAVAIAVSTALRRPAPSRHWWLLAAAFGLWTAADAFYSSYAHLLHREIGFPAAPDALYLSGYAAMLAAMGVLIRRRSRHGMNDVLDALILCAGGGLLLWQVVVARTAHESGSWLPTVVAVVYPTMDLVLIVAMAQLVLTPGRRNFSFRALVAGGAALFVVDVLYSIGSLDGTYASGSWLDTGWIAHYTLWAAAAAHPSMRSLHRSVPGADARFTWWRIGFLAAATATAPVIMYLHPPHADKESIVLLAVALVMVALVFVRMALLFRQHGLAVAALQRTETQRASEHEANARFQIAATTLECAVYESDGRTVTWTAGLTTAFGYRLDETDPGLEWWLERVHPDDRDRLAAAIAESQRLDAPGDAEYRFRAADGRYRHVWDRWSPVRSGPGSRTIGGMVDVTDRKALEDALHQAQKLEAIGTLAGGVAHDFNNLLMAIRGAAELARARTSDERATALLHEIERTSDRGASLTQQLLAFSRRQTLDEKVLDLNCAVRAMTPMLERLLGDDLVVRSELGPGVLPVRADPARLDQVLVNLGVNARDAMPDGGVLTLSTAAAELDADEAAALGVEAGSYARLEVADTGTGMSPEVLAQVFEPFFTTKDVGQGTGLGLATVYGIVSQSRGAITVATQPGQGARFTIHLPLVDAPLDVEPAPAEPEPSRGRGTVLVVEDEPLVRELVCEMLAAEGYEVVSAAHPAEALALADAGAAVDLVLADVAMPGMTGPALAGELLLRDPSLRVVFTSGYAEGAAADLGSAPFLQKPFTRAALAQTVRTALEV